MEGKWVYEKPELVRYGRVEEITLGGNPKEKNDPVHYTLHQTKPKKGKDDNDHSHM